MLLMILTEKKNCWNSLRKRIAQNKSKIVSIKKVINRKDNKLYRLIVGLIKKTYYK